MKKIVLFFFFKILDFSIYFNLQNITALLLLISLRKLKRVKYKIIKKKFIILHKAIGIDDIIDGYNKKESSNLYLVLDRRVLKKFYYHFVKKDKLNDYDYYTKDKKILISQKKYHNYLLNIFQKVHKLYPFDGFINFNPFYKTEVELQKVSTKLKIKFISIHKEAIHPKSYQKCLKWIYKNTASKFYGTKILTYNNFEKKMLVETNIAKSSIVKVVGMPRLIKSIQFSKKNLLSNNRNIVLFTSTNRYLPYYNNTYFKTPTNNLFKKKTFFDFDKIQNKTFKLLVKILKKENNVNLTIKMRPGQKLNLSIFNKFGSRVKIKTIGSGHSYLERNNIVIAFNSTILLEAFAAKKNIFAPFQNYKNPELFEFNKYAICSNSPKFLEKKILNIIKNKKIKNFNNGKKIYKILKLYTYNHDSKSGQRLKNELEKY